MAVPRFPNDLVRKLRTIDLPLQALRAVRAFRDYLDCVEEEAILRARELGASPADIGEALGITRQGVYNKLRIIQRKEEEVKRTIVVPDLEPKTETEAEA